MINTNLNGRTPDIAEENIEKLKTIFPDVFIEGKVDFEKLQQVLGKYIETSNERYNFTWNGKAKALRLSQAPSTGTLRPCIEESKDWDTTQNLYIEGDNLEVLKLLQKSYHSKVKMIYIDPPYNTGKDFVYPDNFTDSIENYKKITGQTDSEGNNTSNNSETSGRYHTDWLNMMYPRLRLSRNLLTDEGLIFISIDDNEVDNLKKICNEVFGEESFVSDIIWQKKTGASDAKGIATITEHIITYSRNINYILTAFTKNKDSYDINRYKYQDEFYAERGPYYIDNLDRGGLQYSDSLNYGIQCPDGTQTYPNGRTEYSNDGWIWKWSKQKIEWARGNKFIEFRPSTSKKSGWSVCYKNYLLVDNEGNSIERAAPHKNLITSVLNANAAADMKALFNSTVFQYTKPVELIKTLLSYVNFSESSIVLDFFSGSATTAHAVMQLNADDGGNRKFIMVQLPEPTDEKDEAYKVGYKNICEIGKERIRRAGEKIKEEKGLEAMNLDVGFKVLKLDSSNIQKWQPDYDYLELSLTEFVNNYVDGRTELDVVYEIMLKYGLDLSYPVNEYKIDGKKVYSIGFGMLIICLDSEITTSIAQGILDLAKELSPDSTRVVFKDNGFKTDSNKTNIKEILKCGGVEEFITL